MTDLERARALLRTAFRACSYDEGDGYTTIHATGGLIVILHKDFAQALAAARREGAERERKLMAEEKWFEAGVLTGAAEMRERALDAARDGVRVAFDPLRDGEFIGEHDVIACIEDAFASVLPLTPEEPAGTHHLTPSEQRIMDKALRKSVEEPK